MLLLFYIIIGGFEEMKKFITITLETLEKICGVLECKIEDIVEIITED